MGKYKEEQSVMIWKTLKSKKRQYVKSWNWEILIAFHTYIPTKNDRITFTTLLPFLLATLCKHLEIQEANFLMLRLILISDAQEFGVSPFPYFTFHTAPNIISEWGRVCSQASLSPGLFRYRAMLC